MGTEGGATIAQESISATNAITSDNSNVLVPPSDADGVIPRAVYDLFETRRQLPDGENRVSIEMSYLEIYNEEARDLLVVAAEGNTGSTSLQIRDRPDGVVVQGLSTLPVSCPQDVTTKMNQAALKRATASTAMNAVSSRSHAICTLHVTIAPLNTSSAGQTADTDQGDDHEEEQDTSSTEFIRAKLTLVDLAGSERIKRTGAEGKRMKEGININKGLFVLGQVVSALSELGQQGKSANAAAHIPYRDSKLTRLLQDSLGGNSKTVMVACISPADSNVEESINTLRYAQRTRNIQNSAKRNVVAANNNNVAALQRENQLLKQQLAQVQAELVTAKASTAAVTTSNTYAMEVDAAKESKSLVLVSLYLFSS